MSAQVSAAGNGLSQPQPTLQEVDAILQGASAMRNDRIADDMEGFWQKTMKIVTRVFSKECPVFLSSTMQGVPPSMVTVAGQR